MVDLAYNDYIEIQQRGVATRDAAGAPTYPWPTLRSIWCRVADLTVKEYLAASAEQASSTLKVFCYWDDVSDVTGAMRLAWGTRTLQIVGTPMRAADGVRATIMCTEITS